MRIYFEDDQASIFDPATSSGKTCQEPSQAAPRRARTSELSSKKLLELVAIPYQSLDLTPGNGNLLGESYWEILSPWRGDALTLNTGVSPSVAKESSLWQTLEDQPHQKYYLTEKACSGILRRADERGKELPAQLKEALEVQAGLRQMPTPPSTDEHNPLDLTHHSEPSGFDGYNGDLTGPVTSTLGTNCGMSTGRTGVIQPKAIGIDSKHATETGDKASTLGTNCGSSTGRTGVMQPMAFATNQRSEVRDLQGRTGALATTHSPKQATLIAGFLGDSSATARSIGYQEECSPTLKSEEKSPMVLCLNDQGGQVMSCSENITGTLRAQEHGHQPLLLESNQNHATIRTDGKSTTLPASMGMGGGYVPMVCVPEEVEENYATLEVVPQVYENHGIDARVKGPLNVAPTMSARYGTGGNNIPLVGQPEKVFCIVGNTIDREPENGGNGIGCQEDISYTLTATDRHAVYSRQRVDIFKENDVVCTESARQHKDATDLVVQTYQDKVGTLGHSDHKGINNQYVDEDKCVVERANLIRRLTPLECERLQGFPDYFTDIPDASDSARYKALGNSVAIPCVDFLMEAIVLHLAEEAA